MMTSNSNVKQPDKHFEISDYAQNHNPYKYFTISAIGDDLTYYFSSKCEFQIDAKTKIICLKHNYLDYAEKFLYLINLCETIPKFELRWQDIPQKLQEYLTQLDKNTVNSILTSVVRRILERVDPVYFHTTSIYGKVKWRIID